MMHCADTMLFGVHGLNSMRFNRPGGQAPGKAMSEERSKTLDY